MGPTLMFNVASSSSDVALERKNANSLERKEPLFHRMNFRVKLPNPHLTLEVLIISYCQYFAQLRSRFQSEICANCDLVFAQDGRKVFDEIILCVLMRAKVNVGKRETWLISSKNYY